MSIEWVIGAGVAVVAWAVRVEQLTRSNRERVEILADDIKYIRERIDRALNGYD